MTGYFYFSGKHGVLICISLTNLNQSHSFEVVDALLIFSKCVAIPLFKCVKYTSCLLIALGCFIFSKPRTGMDEAVRNLLRWLRTGSVEPESQSHVCWFLVSPWVDSAACLCNLFQSLLSLTKNFFPLKFK